MTVGRAVVASVALVLLAGCHGNPPAVSQGTSTTISTTTSPGAAVTTTTGPAGSTTRPGGSPAVTNPSVVLPSLEVTSPQAGQTVGLPIIIQYRVRGAPSAQGLSILASLPGYQLSARITTLAGSVSVPGNKMVSGLRDLSIVLLDHGTAVPPPGAAVTVPRLLITGGR